MNPSSYLSRRWRYLTSDIVRSEPWRHRTRALVWIVLLVVIVLEGILIMQPTTSQNATDPHAAIRTAPTAIEPIPKATPTPTPTPTPTVLPPSIVATTLVPATPAEQAAFKAGQRSCQTTPDSSFATLDGTQRAAFEAGRQWCHSLNTVGGGSGTR